MCASRLAALNRSEAIRQSNAQRRTTQGGRRWRSRCDFIFDQKYTKRVLYLYDYEGEERPHLWNFVVRNAVKSRENRQFCAKCPASGWRDISTKCVVLIHNTKNTSEEFNIACNCGLSPLHPQHRKLSSLRRGWRRDRTELKGSGTGRVRAAAGSGWGGRRSFEQQNMNKSVSASAEAGTRPSNRRCGGCYGRRR